jgi:hypothetical protein
VLLIFLTVIAGGLKRRRTQRRGKLIGTDDNMERNNIRTGKTIWNLREQMRGMKENNKKENEVYKIIK